MRNGHGLLELLNRRAPFLVREMPFGRRNVFGDGLVCAGLRTRSPFAVEEPASNRQHHRAGHEANYNTRAAWGTAPAAQRVHLPSGCVPDVWDKESRPSLASP